jgi:Fe2+ or Zn2+ uptake regulation protein
VEELIPRPRAVVPITARLTPQRRAVLDIVTASVEHLSAADVFVLVRPHRPRIGFGTVYAALHYLVTTGLLAEVRRPDGTVAYDRRTSHHDHVACRACGALADIDPVAVPAYRQIEAQTGYAVEAHTVEFIGLCPSCRHAFPPE